MPHYLMNDSARERNVSEQVLIPQLSLQSMFWRPKFTDDSSWYRHVPAAFWLIEAHYPQRVVELGCDEPAAYFAFCQALERLNPLCQSQAFSTRPLRQALLEYNDAQYQEFSSLQQATEQQALEELDDESVDLMHVSPSAAAALLENWQAWERKLSPSALVVISEAQSRTGERHGAKLYHYLKESSPHFLFAQGGGLGIVAVGEQQPDVISRLLGFSSRDPSARLIQQVFSRLGMACAPSNSSAKEVSIEELAQIAAERDERTRELVTLTERLESVEHREQQERHQRELLAAKRDEGVRELATLTKLLESAERREQQERQQREQAETRLATLEAKLNKEHAARQELERATVAEREQAERRVKELHEHTEQLEARNRDLQAEQAQRFEEIVQLTRMLEERAPEEDNEIDAVSDAKGPEVAEMPLAFGASTKTRLMDRVIRAKGAREIKRQAQQIKDCGLFDAEWYLATYPDVRESGMSPLEHFLRFGAHEERSPGPNFDSHWYLTEYPDVAETGMNPLLHYIKFGRSEQRLPVRGDRR